MPLLTTRSLTILLRLDQTEVSVLSFIEHSDAAGVRIAKNHKVVCPVREFQRRFLCRHRLHVVAAGIDNPPPPMPGPLLFFRTPKGRRGLFRPIFAGAKFLP